jgi:putative redox protein
MSEEKGGLVAGAIVAQGGARYTVDIRTGHHRFIADEPAADGGGDAGPSPFGLLLASLGACTAITLRMHAERKSWPLTGVEVALTYRWKNDLPSIERRLRLDGLDEEQRARCAEIAEKTPVTRALKRGIEITTTLQPPKVPV